MYVPIALWLSLIIFVDTLISLLSFSKNILAIVLVDAVILSITLVSNDNLCFPAYKIGKS